MLEKILGCDLSLTSFGWFLNDGKKKLSYGRFKTSKSDGIDIKRFMVQRDRFINIINNHKIDHIGIEKPFLRSFNTEKLYALHQFVLEVCYTRHINIVYFTPAQIKQYVTSNHRAEKNEMVLKTREKLGLTREKINNDEADAYWVSVLARRFWELYYGLIKEEDLTEKERFIFIKNKSKKPGTLYKQDEDYFIF